MDSQLCVDGLLEHYLHDGFACVGAAVGGGVDRDGLLRCSGILLSVDVDSGRGEKGSSVVLRGIRGQDAPITSADNRLNDHHRHTHTQTRRKLTFIR